VQGNTVPSAKQDHRGCEAHRHAREEFWSQKNSETRAVARRSLMPLLEAKTGGGYCAKANIKGLAVTFHLTRLSEAPTRIGHTSPVQNSRSPCLRSCASGPCLDAARVAKDRHSIGAQQFDFKPVGRRNCRATVCRYVPMPGGFETCTAAWETKRGIFVESALPEFRSKPRSGFTLSVPLSLVTLWRCRKWKRKIIATESPPSCHSGNGWQMT